MAMMQLNLKRLHKGLSIVLLFSMMFSCKSPVNNGNAIVEDAKAIEKETDLRVGQIKEKTSDVSLNEHGFWEAEPEAGIRMVFIPGGNFFMGTDRGLKSFYAYYPNASDQQSVF